MGNSQQDPQQFDRDREPQPDRPIHVDSCRCPQLNEIICRCRIGCACCQSRSNGDHDCRCCRWPSPMRGRSPNARSIVDSPSKEPTQARPEPQAGAHEHAVTTSNDGQEGVEAHQPFEVGDLGMHTWHSIEREFARRDPLTWPVIHYNSPAASMNAEPRSGSQSVISSIYLPSVRSSEGLLGFVGTGSEVQLTDWIPPHVNDVPSYIITPLCLNFERAYCRNGLAESARCPFVLDIDEE